MDSKTKKFIEKAKIKHGLKFDYSKVKVTSYKLPVDIKCKTHGIFRYSPADHLRTKGCPKCSGKSKLNTKEFISNARAVHGMKYLYNKTIYVRAHKKVTITCRRHGDFEQYPTNHVSLGNGCPVCTGNKRLNSSLFVKKAKIIHGNTYDYKKVDYVNSISKIIIICKVHGEFTQTPSNHLTGFGCRECGIVSSHLTSADAATRWKTYKLGRREVKVQGYEPFALDYLINKRSIAPSSIEVSRYKIPIIKYYNTFKRRDSNYFPDIYIESTNTIIEVKSNWTFTQDLTELKLKAKATLLSGFKFKLMVFNYKAELLKLPAKWYNLTNKELKCMLIN